MVIMNSSSAWHNVESTFVGHLDKQGRIVFSVKLQAELRRPDSPIRPRLRQVDGDKVLRQIRNSWIVQLGNW